MQREKEMSQGEAARNAILLVQRDIWNCNLKNQEDSEEKICYHTISEFESNMLALMTSCHYDIVISSMLKL